MDAVSSLWKEIDNFVKKNKLKGLYIGVLDPSVEYSAKLEKAGFKHQDILYSSQWNASDWGTSTYDKTAQKKGMLCLREKMHSGDVPKHRLRSGDVRYMGGVYHKGIIVFVSGGPQKKDHELALKIAKKIEELAAAAYEEWLSKNEGVACV